MFNKKDSENRVIEKMIDRKVRQTDPSGRPSSLSDYSTSGRGGFGGGEGVSAFILKLSAYVAGVLTDVTANKIVPVGSLIGTSTNDGTVTMRNEAINDPQYWMGY